MFVNDLLSAGAMPSLEMSVRFAGERQRLLAHNIANLTTPNFTPLDVSPIGFQKALAEAIADRDARTGGMVGELRWKDTSELRRRDDGGLEFNPQTPSGNILFHDRNNRDVERLMQDHAENLAVFRTSSELLRSRMQLMRETLAERV
jgi:flagellar basal-body rod protein FlgB